MNSKSAQSNLSSLWTVDFILITAVMTLMRICTQVQTTAMPLYFQYLGENKTLAGLSMTVFTIAAMVCRPMIGSLIDKRGRKPILLIGMVLYALSTLAYGFIALIPLLIMFRIVHGASFSATSTAASAMVTDVVPEKRMTQGLAYFGLFSTLSIAIAPWLTLYLIDHTSYNFLFSATAGLAIITLFISFGIRSDRSRISKIDEHLKTVEVNKTIAEPQTKQTFFDSFIVRKALPPTITILFVAIATSAVSVFLPTYALHVGISNIGYFFVVQAASLAIASIIVGPLSKKVGPRNVILGSLLTLAISFFGISQSESLLEILTAAGLFGFASGLLMPQLNSLAVLSATPDQRGKASAMYYLALDIGIGGGAAIWGIISDTLGIEWIYIIAGLLLFLTWITVGFKRPNTQSTID